MKTIRFALAASALAISTAAAAQQAPSPQAAPPAAASSTDTSDTTGDIVVTAQKRSENLSKVPLAITAFSGEQLTSRGIAQTSDLQTITPGLLMQPTNRETVVAIRGIANNVRAISADPSVATYLDGVYLSRSNMVLGALYDVQRVEVLKGPQGTLYGRNATGGVINIISQQPTDTLSGNGYIGGGSYGLMEASAALNAPITDGTAIRISGYYAHDDGYTKNLTDQSSKDDQTNIRSVRGVLKSQLSSAITFHATAEYTDDRGNVGYGYSQTPYPALPGLPTGFLTAPQFERQDPRNIRHDTPYISRRKSFVGSASLDADLGFATAKLIYGHTDYRANDLQDIDLSSDPAFGWYQISNVKSKADTLEAQIASNGSGRFNYTAGVFAYQETAHEFIFLNEDGVISLDTQARNRSLGAYAELSYKLTDTLTVLGGLRYTTEDKKADTVAVVLPSGAGKVSYNSATPRARITWQATPDVMAYFNFAQGFKAGGLNSQQANLSFKPERVTDYDAGVKATLLDNRFFIDASVFHYDYKDLQLRNAVVSGTATLVTINNAGSANITGGEISGRFRVGGGFSLDGGLTYLDSKLHGFVNRQGIDYNDQPLPLAPKWEYSLGGQYDANFGETALRLRADWNHRSSYLFASNLRDYRTERSPGYGLLNLSARLTFKNHMYVEVLGRNVTDKLYAANLGDFRGAPGLEANYGAPRTIEGRVGFEF
ncbi:TonB-dependent receptor [Stakelama pacifica]|uniref:Iron complex outermembrane receptor protein n=1 Tax=Stakelama pacifica TaxID=517720 RepID=A0A4R6FAT6_9SPHN|nr:TonB-dependent receptor [Stakelama pacifica]TDN78259.1 iron complex outermembrane receptor protein [Stakelama pacifica]GGO99779.1 TonB-dependent receptor [Stakelama pacifica]